MSDLYRYLVISNDRIPRLLRGVYRSVQGFSLPAPKIVFKPILLVFLAMRGTLYWLKRVFIAEPFFKAYCKHVGRGFRTDVFIHWVQGKGDIVVGDYVTIDGKCSFIFSSRYTRRPSLEIGEGTGIGNDCGFTVGKSIKIGRHCMIAGGTSMFDSNGHPSDPEARLAGLPPDPEEVRPINIADNVWIGVRSTIFPGVNIGEGSIVSANSVVRSNVRPYTIVAGNPARKIADLPRPAKDDSAARAVDVVYQEEARDEISAYAGQANTGGSR